MLGIFDLMRFLSQAGCSYDNVVAESTYHFFKIEFKQLGIHYTLENLLLKTKDSMCCWDRYLANSSLS